MVGYGICFELFSLLSLLLIISFSLLISLSPFPTLKATLRQLEADMIAWRMQRERVRACVLREQMNLVIERGKGVKAIPDSAALKAEVI